MANSGRDPLQLLQEIQNGSLEAFSQFYDRYIDFIFRIAYQVTRNLHDAEDVCHEVFLEVYRHPCRYQPSKGSVEAWLAVLARSRSLDLLRRKKHVIPQETFPEAEQKSVPSLEEEVVLNFVKQSLYHALQKLPRSQQQAVIGSYLEGRTHQELSVRYQRPLGTIKSLIRYGIQNLRKYMNQFGWETSSGEGREP